MTAPVIMHFIVYFGEPSARIMAVNAGQMSWKGIPQAMTRR